MTTTGKTLFLVSLFAAASCSVLRAQREQPIREGESQIERYADMRYPPYARSARIQGAVVVQVRIGDRGEVTEATALSGREVLAIPSLENVKKWIFEPNFTNTAIVVYNFVILPGVCTDEASLFIRQGSNLATIFTCPPNPTP